MRLRVLIADADPEHLLFIGNALAEIEEGRCAHGFRNRATKWMQVETHHATCLEEAEAALAGTALDAVLLALDLDGKVGAQSFRRIQAAAPSLPIVLIAPPEDRDLAAQLVREGAQDFLIRGEIDCGPLLHAITNAMERQRLLCALRTSTKTDPLTGLLNQGGFDSAARRDCALAERLNLRYLLVVLEPALLEQYALISSDLPLVEFADELRSLAGPTGLIARLSANRFALTFFESAAESIDTAWARTQAAIRTSGPVRVGVALLDSQNPASFEGLLEQAENDLAHRGAARASAGGC